MQRGSGIVSGVCVALIPARGGSKRVPRKNLLPFFGHPMLSYAVAAARNSGLFQHVLVSTDDRETGKVASWYGAEYVPRPPELAGDEAGLQDVALHALDWLADRGARPDMLCQLMPNCPLRRAEDIRQHHEVFERERRDFQISVVPYRCVYPHWAMVQEPAGGRFLFGEEFLVGSQRLREAFCPTGAIWWTRCAAFRRQRSFYGTPYFLAPMDANRGVDIDTAQDVEFAELLVHGLTQRDGRSPLEPIARAAFAGGARG